MEAFLVFENRLSQYIFENENEARENWHNYCWTRNANLENYRKLQFLVAARLQNKTFPYQRWVTHSEYCSFVEQSTMTKYSKDSGARRSCGQSYMYGTVTYLEDLPGWDMSTLVAWNTYLAILCFSPVVVQWLKITCSASDFLNIPYIWNEDGQLQMRCVPVFSSRSQDHLRVPNLFTLRLWPITRLVLGRSISCECLIRNASQLSAHIRLTQLSSRLWSMYRQLWFQSKSSNYLIWRH